SNTARSDPRCHPQFKWLARDDFTWLTADQFRNLSSLAPLVGGGLLPLLIGIALGVGTKSGSRPGVFWFGLAVLRILMVAIVVYVRPKLAGRYAWPAWIGIDLLLTCGLLAASRLIMRRAPMTLAVIGALVFVVIPWATARTGHPPDSDFRGAFAYIR